MKKYCYLLGFFLIASCQEMMGYCNVTQSKQQESQLMYNAFGTSIVDMDSSTAAELFGKCYYRGDDVYIYKTLWGNKYVLARDGKAVTYIEGDAYDAKKKKNSGSDYYKNKSNQSTPQKQSQWF